MTHKKVENIEEFNAFFHQPTSHPLVSVGNLAAADLTLFSPMDFGMYCVVLMDVDFGELLLRGSCMRYRPRTMFTMKPGDVVSMHLDSTVKPKGWMLVFRPELLNGSGLARDFYMFNFFDYDVAEALTLTDEERKVALNCFSNINAELRSQDDEFTSHMLRLNISIMLTSCRRFYERQFDTENIPSSNFRKRLESLLDSYLSDGSQLTKTLGQPSVAWCADQFHLSPSYFGDMVHRELGTTAQAFIKEKIMDRAKSLLANDSLSINDVASLLGFEYPNHFSRFFTNNQGITPTNFRKQLL